MTSSIVNNVRIVKESYRQCQTDVDLYCMILLNQGASIIVLEDKQAIISCFLVANLYTQNCFL